ncbi:hypothetical protein [Streptomyces sp. NRRL S-118]|nr:hypothetical protein [Streptomyces sp. NRRL S-118]
MSAARAAAGPLGAPPAPDAAVVTVTSVSPPTLPTAGADPRAGGETSREP